MNNKPNNGGGGTPSLSPSVKERDLESQGKNLMEGKARAVTPPPIPKSNPSSSNASLPKQGGIPSQERVGSKEGIGSQGGLPPRESINSGAGTPAAHNGQGGGVAAGGKSNPQAQALKNRVASAALQAAGVPKAVSDMAVNSKLGKKAMTAMQDPAKAALNGVKNVGKSEAEKDAAEKEEEEKEKEKTTGGVTLRVPLSVKLTIFLGILPSFCFIIIFMMIIVSYVADEKAFNIFMGKIVGDKDASDIYDFKEEMGMGGTLDDIGMGTGGITFDEFLNRYQNLGNIYEYFDCESKEECLERDEVKFYIKVNDIMLRYYHKYNGINLDWELLMSTVLSLDIDVKEMFKELWHSYNYDDVENYEILMDLDWDYDYKKIPGYDYLSPSDYRYDLQILAKNMVTKTTTQTCTKLVRNEDGSTSTVVTKTRTDTDIEDMYLQPGQPYYLKCDAGETYHISSNYRLDMDKYDEFLSEYLEKKLYLPETADDSYIPDENGQITIDHVTGDSLSAKMVNLALAQQGIEGSYEHNGDNNVIYNTWYYGREVSGSAYPWCAAFVSWVVAHTEHDGTQLLSILNHKSASVQNWASYFQNTSTLQLKNSSYLGGNYTPKQGDMIFFSWKGDNGCSNTGISTMDHIGIVVEVQGNNVITIEGNTANKVATRTYALDSCEITAYGVWY